MATLCLHDLSPDTCDFCRPWRVGMIGDRTYHDPEGAAVGIREALERFARSTRPVVVLTGHSPIVGLTVQAEAPRFGVPVQTFFPPDDSYGHGPAFARHIDQLFAWGGRKGTETAEIVREAKSLGRQVTVVP